jgi:hypothetical protein
MADDTSNESGREPGQGMADHGRRLAELNDASDEELQARALDAGIDGAQTMDRDHLIAKLIGEPGVNEL